MVDLPGDLGSIPPAVVVWCLVGKCGYEALDRLRHGEAGGRAEERAKFTACFVRCVSPVDLPDTSGCGCDRGEE
jgi:hypothetical protein